MFSVLIAIITKSTEKLIACGDQDDIIIKEYVKQNRKRKKTKDDKVSYTANILLSLVFVVLFIFTLCINLNTKSFSTSIPTLRVVESDSMSKKHVENGYLEENGLNDQFHTFDIVLTYKLPKEEELKLYDIIVYEIEERLVIHRIVKIEEPNERHPNETWFITQGDAVSVADRNPVTYEQMRGIYRGKNIPFVGSFVIFLQSFAGWLCVALLVGCTLIAPALDNRLEKRRKERLEELMYAPVESGQAWGCPDYWYGGYY